MGRTDKREEEPSLSSMQVDTAGGEGRRGEQLCMGRERQRERDKVQEVKREGRKGRRRMRMKRIETRCSCEMSSSFVFLAHCLLLSSSLFHGCLLSLEGQLRLFFFFFLRRLDITLSSTHLLPRERRLFFFSPGRFLASAAGWTSSLSSFSFLPALQEDR